MPSDFRLLDIVREQDYQQTEADLRLPVSAEIDGHDGTTCNITVPSFSNGIRETGIAYNHTSLSDGTAILVCMDENGTWWVLAP